MRQIPNSYIEKKTAITFLSGSAGELDWVLPILDYLSKKNFNISIVFLTRHARASVEKNSMLKNYISQKNIQPEVHLCGGYLAEKIERLGYLAHRAAIKLKLQNNNHEQFVVYTYRWAGSSPSSLNGSQSVCGSHGRCTIVRRRLSKDDQVYYITK